MNKCFAIGRTLGLLSLLFYWPAYAVEQSPYSGQEIRNIKSLSAQDVDDLLAGRGWGFAKPAELNGLPGPLHVLELESELKLNDVQRDRIQALYANMRSRAQFLGKKYVDMERDLDRQITEPKPSGERLQEKLKAIGEVRAELRFVHLDAHLKMPGILRADQIANYNRLRGYSLDDPCSTIPAGHNETMWRQHNGCAE